MTLDLTPLRELLQADGGDIELIAYGAGTAHLRLVLHGAQCAECVLPRSMLEEVALDLLQPSAPELVGVVVDDPREGGETFWRTWPTVEPPAPYPSAMGTKSTPSGQPKKPSRTLKEKRAAKQAKEEVKKQTRRGWETK